MSKAPELLLKVGLQEDGLTYNIPPKEKGSYTLFVGYCNVGPCRYDEDDEVWISEIDEGEIQALAGQEYAWCPSPTRPLYLKDMEDD